MIWISRRFNGPPHSGNGGYVAGLLAAHMDGPAEVTLRRPPPLDRELAVQAGNGRATLMERDTIVAEAVSIPELDLDVPQPVTVQDARGASSAYAGLREHVFPSCFVCGPEREEGDGLRIFPARVPDREIVAATWTPTADLAGADGDVRAEFIWAAMDCPGAWTFPENGRPFVLGRIAARIDRMMQTGKPYVVTGWALGRDGRKLHSAAALRDPHGNLLAVARHTWIELAES